MLRIVENGVHGAPFHHLAETEHSDPVAHAFVNDDVRVDEQVGQPEPRLQFEEQVDDPLGFGRERPGNAHELAPPAGKLVRVAVDICRLQAGLTAGW